VLYDMVTGNKDMSVVTNEKPGCVLKAFRFKTVGLADENREGPREISDAISRKYASISGLVSSRACSFIHPTSVPSCALMSMRKFPLIPPTDDLHYAHLQPKFRVFDNTNFKTAHCAATLDRAGAGKPCQDIA
jgi:hypothetical protein